MKIVEPAVETEAVHVASVRSVVSQCANSGMNLFIVRDEGATIAEGTKVLLNDEAGRRRIAKLRDFESVAVRADSLRIVFEDEEFVLIRDFANCFHIRALAIQVHWDNRFGFGSDGCFDLCGINAFRDRITINKDRRSAGNPNAFSRSEKGIGVSDDFVASANTKRHQRKPDGIGAITKTDGVFRAVISSQFGLEALEHRAHDILAAFKNSLDILVNLRL